MVLVFLFMVFMVFMVSGLTFRYLQQTPSFDGLANPQPMAKQKFRTTTGCGLFATPSSFLVPKL